MPPPEQPHMPPQEQPCMPPGNNHACPPGTTMHASPEQPCMPPPREQPHMPPWSNHAHPLEQPCMPPRATMHAPPTTMHAPPNNHAHPPGATTHTPPGETMHAPLGATMHAPLGATTHAPHMPPRSNHTCPPGATTHAPPEQPCMPSKQPCTPPRATTQAPRDQPRTPPVNRRTNRCKNITLPQTSFAGGNYTQCLISVLLRELHPRVCERSSSACSVIAFTADKAVYIQRNRGYTALNSSYGLQCSLWSQLLLWHSVPFPNIFLSLSPLTLLTWLHMVSHTRVRIRRGILCLRETGFIRRRGNRLYNCRMRKGVRGSEKDV